MLLYQHYSDEIPLFLAELASTPEMQRLRYVGMNCGCEYTNFTHFRSIGSYSRFEHSLGVGLIVWNFTHDKVQAASALLHDIATPVFAHVIDFLNGDHMTQESTENGTAEIICASPDITRVLAAYSIAAEAVIDYHRFPLADNDSPKLSADRLEYTFGNLVNYGFAPCDKVDSLYVSITAAANEYGEPELVFIDADKALEFARFSLMCSRVYVCDEDRYAMQMCAELIGSAVADGVINKTDLWLTEPEFIVKLCSDSKYKQKWNRFCSYSSIIPGMPDDPDTRIIKAKKRYIDPYVIKTGRVSELFPIYGRDLKEFLAQTQDHMICGI